MKKIRIFFLCFLSVVLVLIILVYCMFSQQNNKKSIIQDTYINNEYYDIEKNQINEKLLYFVFYENDYNDKPITENFKNKHPISLIKEFGLEKFDYRNNEPNSTSNYYDLLIEILNNNTIQIETLYCSSLGSEPIVFSTIEMQYFLNDKGYLDDVVMVNVNKFRNDDGTLITKSDSIKFFSNDLVLNYVQELVYGIDLINYKFKYFRNENFGTEPYDEIISRFDMYALSTKFKSQYNKNDGIIAHYLVKEAIDNQFDIIVSVNFKKKYDNMYPLKLFKNDKIMKEGYLVLEVDENGFLDRLEVRFSQ